MPDYPSLSALGGALRDYWNRAGSFPMTTSTGVTITPEDIQRGMNLGMSFSGGGLGIKAYHGSPHNFERFSTGKIGTGEGAQTYGQGLYAAEKEPVAQSYRVAGKDLDVSEAQAIRHLENNNWDKVKARQNYISNRVDHEGNMIAPDPDVLKAIENPPGHMYEVNINADPEHFLDWDKKWSEQPESVQKLLRASGINPESRGPMGTKTLSDSTLGELAGQRLKDPNSLINRKAR